ncbi:hypothetical protein KIN20_009773 [Parelaphostrongylus tenuis]|uniref:Uncharacterized protein n=1 Tax=Parelaphostrongylus tenuis TaxID=148309 RepID=A0AAD5M8M6_PARTN|nr:hypothetical protein KIN20_009773 [Parelaphostrongylus tenuis]
MQGFLVFAQVTRLAAEGSVIDMIRHFLPQRFAEALCSLAGKRKALVNLTKY